MNLLKFAFLFALAVLTQGTSNAQDWVSYKSQQQINDLIDTGDELLMATNAGLVVMDKSTLEKSIINVDNSNLNNNHIQSIAQAPDGSNWIGTYDVILMRVDGSNFDSPIVPESDFYDPETTMLYDFEFAPNGDLWIGTTDGLFHKENSNWYRYDNTDIGIGFAGAWDIEINDAGDVFIGSGFVFKFSDGIWSNVSEPAQLGSYIGADLFFSTSGDMYFAGDLDYVGRFDGTDWELFDVPINKGTDIKGFAEDTNGDIYFHSLYDGIFKLENDTWMQQADAQAFNGRTSLFYIDEENIRWTNNNIHLSVNTNGVVQSTTISQHSIAHNSVHNMHKGNNGKMYFVTDSGNDISVVDSEGNWTFLPLSVDTEFFEIYNDVLFIADNDIWVGSNLGLHHYDGIEWTFDQTGDIQSFAIDSQGKIYVRNVFGIIEIENGVAGNPSIEFISGHGVDANDNLWLAIRDENTIQKISPDGNVTTYTGTTHPAIDLPTGDFHFDDNGNVWVSSAATGAIKYDGTTFTNPFTGNDDLIENNKVLAITNDATGKMYFSHQYGVTTLLDEEWEDLLIEEVPNENVTAISDIKFDDNGTLWWASDINGVFSYTPGSISAVSSSLERNADLSIYPNPARSYTIIDAVIPKSTQANVFIYNGPGQLVSSLDLGQLTEGNFQQRIDLSHLAKGFYTIQLQLNNNFFTKTVIVQ